MTNIFFKKIDKVLRNTDLESFMANILTSKVSLRDRSSIVLIQAIEDLYHYSIFAIILDKIAKKKSFEAQLCLFRTIVDGESKNGFLHYIKSRCLARLLNLKWKRLYESYCPIVGIEALKIHRFYDFLAFLSAIRLWIKIINGSDLVKLSIGGIYIGDLVSDSYIRYKPNYYVEIKDIYLFVIIWNACKSVRQAHNYFSKNNVKIFFTAYSTYIHHGIYLRVALKFNVPVYSFGNYQNFSKRLTNDDWFHTKYSRFYYLDFLKLTRSAQDHLLIQAEKMLHYRVRGGVDLATRYMRKSAYEETATLDMDVSDGVVVFLHDFYDSPHVFYDMVFPNFWEWACFTIDTLRNAGKKFFVKVHPNQIDLSSDVVRRLFLKYPDLVLIPQNITNLQLVNAGIRVGVTVYGTVSHELAFLGVPSICCARHPHVAFNFCVTAKTRTEYEEFLLEKKICSLSKDELRRQSLIFYAMHNLNISEQEIELRNQLLNLRSMLSDSRRISKNDKSKIEQTICSISENDFLNSFVDEVLGEIQGRTEHG